MINFFNKKIPIAFDLDGVVFDFTQGFVNYLNKKYNRNIQISDIKKYLFYNNRNVCNKEEFDESFNEFINNRGFENLQEIENSYRCIHQLINEDFYPIFITDRNEKLKRFTTKYLKYLFHDCKTIFANKIPKWKYAKKYKCVAIIDNKQEILEETYWNYENCTTILFNTHLDINNSLNYDQVFYDWKSMYNYLIKNKQKYLNQ